MLNGNLKNVIVLNAIVFAENVFNIFTLDTKKNIIIIVKKTLDKILENISKLTVKKRMKMIVKNH